MAADGDGSEYAPLGQRSFPSAAKLRTTTDQLRSIPILSRWHLPDEKSDDGIYLRTRLADLLEANSALLNSTDPALRQSFYRRFNPAPFYRRFNPAPTCLHGVRRVVILRSGAA